MMNDLSAVFSKFANVLTSIINAVFLEQPQIWLEICSNDIHAKFSKHYSCREVS